MDIDLHARARTHAVTNGISKINGVMPAGNLGKFPRLFSDPSTSICSQVPLPLPPKYLSPTSVPLQFHCHCPVQTLASLSPGFHLSPPAGSLSSPFSALALRALFLNQESDWATPSILRWLPCLQGKARFGFSQ